LWFFFRKKKKEAPTIYTVQTCQNCGEKNRRIFESNDYIYKKGASCNKCSGIVIITAIYGEYPEEKDEEEKEKNTLLSIYKE
jgi:hypothetical protein